MKAEAPELRPIVSRYGFDPSVVDPCGPSPVIPHHARDRTHAGFGTLEVRY